MKHDLKLVYMALPCKRLEGQYSFFDGARIVCGPGWCHVMLKDYGWKRSLMTPRINV